MSIDIDKTLSHKFRVLSLVAMIMVIFLHSYNLNNLNTDGFNIILFIENFISNGLARVAVPIFFLISGLLFFKSFSYNQYTEKMRTRIFTLLIPYLFWSVLVVLIYYVLQSVPQLQHYFSKQLIVDMDINTLLIKTWIDPINYPLWFLRDLIVLVIISPIIFFFVTNFYKPFFFIAILSYVLFSGTPSIWYYWSFEALLFFSMGAYINIYKDKVLYFELSNNSFYFLSVLYLVSLTIKTYATSFLLLNGNFIYIIHNIIVMIGILWIWFLLDRINLQNKVLLFLSQFTFLFYVFQEPAITICKKILLSILGKIPEAFLIVYIMVPIVIILFLTLVGMFLQKKLPYFTSLAMGNRSKQ